MPRKTLIKTNEFFYHISTRSNDKRWFQIPLNKVWQISIQAFKKAHENNPAIVSQFVLMSNHYHMLIKTPNADIDRFMFWFNKTFSDQLRNKSQSINRMFGSSYKWSIIKNEVHLTNVFKYIYQNPLRAKIVENCEDYPYSTFHFTSKNKKLPFQFTQLSHLENKVNSINEDIFNDQLFMIKRGLKKTSYRETRIR